MILETKEEGAIAKVSGIDPYIVVDNVNPTFESLIGGRPGYISPLLFILAIVVAIITASSLTQLGNSIKFLKTSLSNKKLIMSLAKNDFKKNM